MSQAPTTRQRLTSGTNLTRLNASRYVMTRRIRRAPCISSSGSSVNVAITLRTPTPANRSCVMVQTNIRRCESRAAQHLGTLPSMDGGPAASGGGFERTDRKMTFMHVAVGMGGLALLMMACGSIVDHIRKGADHDGAWNTCARDDVVRSVLRTRQGMRPALSPASKEPIRCITSPQS